MKRFMLLACLVFALSALDASASLIGDSAGGAILPGIGVVGTQFNSPAVVGPGTEFTGNWLFNPFGMNWLVEVDIAASSFVVDLTNLTGNDNISDGPQMFGIRLFDLDWVNDPTGFITNVNLSGVSGQAKAVDIASIIHGDHDITIFWKAFSGNASTQRGLNRYEFNIDAEHPIPEPSTIILLGVGILGVFGIRWRQRKKAA